MVVFHLNDEQWASIAVLASNLEGFVASDDVRHQLDDIILRAFQRPKELQRHIDALERASKAAKIFHDTLIELSASESAYYAGNDEFRGSLVQQNLDNRAKIARLTFECGEDTDDDYRVFAQDREKPTRGRPADTQITAFSASMLELARTERWATKDRQGRTSPEFMNLLVELADCAHKAGVTHLRDRRALTNAMALARTALEAEHSATAQLRADLDALAHPAPEKAAPSANCLCSVPPKSD
ncbi:hypothetical protein [Methylobacterium brachiatum]|uniref:hypothetical protein n=1 Tax=Methylobacterium brachiatum TaxID=269660 RepID=UPI0008F02F81|nr:hypothetical protein [Methylobacterium brachiatum]SFI85004.1 hypothetical protein SAMN02799642_02904 [Methylobacterium brachiatum]